MAAISKLEYLTSFKYYAVISEWDNPRQLGVLSIISKLTQWNRVTSYSLCKFYNVTMFRKQNIKVQEKKKEIWIFQPQ